MDMITEYGYVYTGSIQYVFLLFLNKSYSVIIASGVAIYVI